MLHPLTRTPRAVLAVAVTVAAAAVLLPSAAHAGAVGIANGTLTFTTGSTENNDLVLRVVGNEIVITDTVPITASSPCRVFNQREAVCPADVGSVGVSTFRGRDTVDYRLPHSGTVLLGPDDDQLRLGRREAIGRPIQAVSYFAGQFPGDPNGGHDRLDYSLANRGVAVNVADGLANDGRPGDLDNVAPGFDVIVGSQFDDTLLGADQAEVFHALGGNDSVAGGHGDDLFTSYNARDGADDYHGGPGFDSIDYFGRSAGVVVSLDNVANDGESGERDNVRSNVENLYGGNGGDVLESLGAHSRLDGRGGDDFLFGGAGPDTLIGGAGVDNLNAGAGNDVVDSRDGQLDTVECGDGTDSLMRDGQERRVVRCETTTVGELRLTPKSTRATAGETVRLRLSWHHPKAWKRLRTIELRLTRDDVPVGAITVRARGKRIAADGALRAMGRGTRIVTRGRTVSARLAVRLDASLAGGRLEAEVEATDTRGRRQLERDAGTIRVVR